MRPFRTARQPARDATRRRGTAVMEAALVFPILLGLTFGSVEFGHFFFVKHTLQGAAREGARAAITPGASAADVTTAVGQSMAASGFQPSTYTVAIRNADDTANINLADASAGLPVLVKVSAAWGTVGVRPVGVIGTTNGDGSVRYVTGQTVMRKEG